MQERGRVVAVTAITLSPAPREFNSGQPTGNSRLSRSPRNSRELAGRLERESAENEGNCSASRRSRSTNEEAIFVSADTEILPARSLANLRRVKAKAAAVEAAAAEEGAKEAKRVSQSGWPLLARAG